MSVLFLNKAQTLFNSQGKPRIGGKVYAYASSGGVGTTTPQDTFSDDSLETPNLNPIVLDSAGRSPNNIYLQNREYSFTITNTDGTDSITVGPIQGSFGTDVSFRDFGAVGDGSIDDTLAVQTAVNSIYALGGGTIRGHAGDVYSITTLARNWDAVVRLNITDANFVKRGSGTEPVLNFSADTDIVDIYSEFSNITITGNAKSSDGFRATNISSFVLRNVKITACDNGFNALGALGFQVYGPNWNSNNIGFKARKSADNIYANQITIVGGSIKANTSFGIDYGQGSGLTLKGVDVEQNGTTATLTTGAMIVRSTVDDESGTARIAIEDSWFEDNLGLTLKVETAAGLDLSISDTEFIASEGGHVADVGAIRSVRLDSVQAPSSGDTFTMAAGASVLTNCIISVLADTSASRRYFNLTSAAEFKPYATSACGNATLIGGTVTVSYNLHPLDRIFVTSQIDGGTPGWLRISARVSNTSFTITSSSGSDTSSVSWFVAQPG